MVIILKEQMRIQDLEWMELLSQSQTGDCTEADLAVLNSLIVTDRTCQDMDFSAFPWSDAILVTPRHSARTLWNQVALRRHCEPTGHAVYSCNAEDTTGSNNHVLSKGERLEVARKLEKDTCKLPSHIEFTVGMKAMVVMNIATKADLANGSWGEVMDAVLDPHETSLIMNNECVTNLQYPPALILILIYHIL
jgi:hypothetical protein